MKKNLTPILWAGLSLFLATLACGFPSLNPTPTPLPPIETATAVPSPTETLVPTIEASPTPETGNPETPTNTTSVECTTLQDVNLRTGPGTAYRDPIGVVSKGSVVVPIGFDPEGVP